MNACPCRVTLCAFCGAPAEGNYSVHRDDMGVGPEVELCDACGSREEPTLRVIWGRIGQAATCVQCDEEIESGDARAGSFHEWCLELDELTEARKKEAIPWPQAMTN